MILRPSRRSVVAFLAGATMWTWGGASPAAADGLPRALLLAALDRPSKARALGALCLTALPSGQDARTLARAVLTSMAASAFQSRIAFRRALGRRIQQDFADGAVVAADGWHLSLTEARLYALAALEGQNGV